MSGVVVRYKNLAPKTPFAPVFEYSIYKNSINLDFDSIKTAILSKEKDIIASFPSYDDGDTGLGKNSLTSRYPYFNLLEWPEMAELKSEIRRCHDDYLKQLGLDYSKPIYVQCWANVMREGEQIGQHQHITTNYSYLGGHISVEVNGTSTHYTNPYTRRELSEVNEVGKITLFPGWIGHRTDEVGKGDIRITIAFDVFNEVGYIEDIFDDRKNHWVKL